MTGFAGFGEDEPDITSFSVIRTARKEHKCGLCLKAIKPGERYNRVSWRNNEDRVWGAYKEHTFNCWADQ